ncbi:MAG: glycosyltransferase, partial [Candidatus Lloydbacteria bacterium]|nr:glycosyltransferase [Candidatus Lloydbacteria bacterium]
PRLGRDINMVDDIAVFFLLISLFKKERPDVIHLHSSKVGGLGALAARLAGVKKIVFTAHGWAFNEPRFFLTRAAIWIASWFTALFAHRIIVITKKERAQTLRMPFLSQKKVAYIPNGIGSIDFLPQISARQALLDKPIHPSAIWIGTISELTANKGLPYAIAAVARLKKETNLPFLFVIIGEGEERAALEKQIAEQNLSDTVFLVGHKKNASQLLKVFDIFTLTSLKEGLPYALLEAGLARVPVVASNIGGIPDIIDKESGILVPPKHPEAIAEALRKLIDDSALRKHFGEHNASRIQETYSLQKMLLDTEKLYK